MKRTLPLLGCLALAWSLLLVAATPGHAATRPGTTIQTDRDDHAPDEFSDPFDDPFAEEEITISDPLEGFNRGVFWLNDKLYIYLIKPVARGWRVVPEPARLAVDRFFTNLSTPIRLVNCILQLKPKQAGTEVGRFVVNSTVGLLGFFDPARSWLGWQRQDEDLGQTLGRYGVGPGIYLVLPILGPSSPRDTLGLIADGFIDPIFSPWYLKLRFWEAEALYSFDFVNTLSLDKDTYESIRKEQLDPYLFIRNAWMQRRTAQIRD